MRLKEIELHYPKEIKEVECMVQAMVAREKEERLKHNHQLNPNQLKEILYSKNIHLANDIDEIKEDYCFCAGAFSNLFMQQKLNYPIRNVINDIDIYVDWLCTDFDFLKKIPGVTVINEYSDRSGYAVKNWESIREVLNFTYKNFKFQVISVYSMDRVKYFDFRFRNFYYKHGKVFASEKAIQDIYDKKMLVVSFATPLATYIRALKFKYELGFSLAGESEQMLFAALNNEKLREEKLKEMVKTVAKDEYELVSYINDEISSLWEYNTGIDTDWMGKNFKFLYFKDVDYPFHPGTKELFNLYDFVVGEDNYQRLANYESIDFLHTSCVIKDYDYKALKSILNNEKEKISELLHNLYILNLTEEFTKADFSAALHFINEESKNKSISKRIANKMMDEILHILADTIQNSQFKDVIPDNYQNMLEKSLKKRMNATFQLDVEDALSSLYSEKVIVKLTNWKKQSIASYIFRKIDNGQFVLEQTSSDDVSLYSKAARMSLVQVLNKHYGQIFGLSKKGDKANTRDFMKVGWWFENADNSKIEVRHDQ